MQTVLNQPTAGRDSLLPARSADEDRELALLTQFMRHHSVASLANAIAEGLAESARGEDLIAAAGLGSSRSDSCGLSGAIRVNSGEGLRR